MDKVYTTEARYSTNRECRMYREMFAYLQETAADMRGETERGSLHTSDGRTHTVPEGATLEGEIGGDMDDMFLVTFK